jgi:type II secretory pathway component PulF
MVNFAWRGTDVRGREQRGECAAEGLVDAAARLRAKGLAPISVERLGGDPAAQFSVTADAFTTFNRNLAEMTSIGLPLARAVGEISSGMRRGRFRNALQQVEAELREGRSLDEAVERVPGVFPPYYRWMLRAGAASGNLPAVLSAVARNAEGIRIARRALFEALAYPLLVILFALILAACGALFYVPLYRDLFQQSGFQAPFSVGILLRVFSSGEAGAAALAGAAGLAMSILFLLRRTVAGERLLCRLPLLGRIRVYLTTARLLGALGIMLRANTPLPQALPVAIGASGSLDLSGAAERLSARASEGRGLGELLLEMPSFPPNVAAYLALSERSGDAPAAAGELSRLLTEQASSESEYLFMILMPAALLASGAFIGSMLIPLVCSYIQFIESLHP